MFKYIIHMVRENTERLTLNGERNIGQQNVAGYQTFNDFNCQFNLNSRVGNNYGNYETWYANDEPTAQLIASIIASQNPGREVYVATTSFIATAPKAKAQLAVVNEKGVVPA